MLHRSPAPSWPITNVVYKQEVITWFSAIGSRQRLEGITNDRSFFLSYVCIPKRYSVKILIRKKKTFQLSWLRLPPSLFLLLLNYRAEHQVLLTMMLWLFSFFLPHFLYLRHQTSGKQFSFPERCSTSPSHSPTRSEQPANHFEHHNSSNNNDAIIINNDHHHNICPRQKLPNGSHCDWHQNQQTRG